MRVQMPPGCVGFRDRNTGRSIDANRQGFVDLDDSDAKRLKKSFHSGVGLVSTEETFSIGTKKGRWCRSCNRVWNAWNKICSKCGADTIPEEEMKSKLAS
jgi:hypothetical protein